VIVSTSSTGIGDERRSHRRTVDDIIERLIVEPIAVASKNAPEAR
jgi:hypothetical protein